MAYRVGNWRNLNVGETVAIQDPNGSVTQPAVKVVVVDPDVEEIHYRVVEADGWQTPTHIRHDDGWEILR